MYARVTTNAEAAAVLKWRPTRAMYEKSRFILFADVQGDVDFSLGRDPWPWQTSVTPDEAATVTHKLVLDVDECRKNDYAMSWYSGIGVVFAGLALMLHQMRL